MKKLRIFPLAVTAALAVSLTGCLKDKGFDDHEYGINYPDKSPTGVGFPLAAKAKNTVGVEVSSTAQTFDNISVLNLTSALPAQGDVGVTLAIKPAIVTDYNTATGSSIVPMPVNLFSLQSLNVTIPSGERMLKVPVTISNTTGLDPNQTYGIGIEIASATNGVQVAQNLKNLLIEITIKNKYHGTYHATGYFYHPSAPRAVDEEKEVVTAGANSVTVNLGDLGTSGYVAKFTIDDVTNAVTIETAPGAAGGPYTMFTAGLPSTGPGYTAAWAGSASCNNTYDPVTKTFKVRYGYSGSGGWRVTEEHIVRQ